MLWANLHTASNHWKSTGQTGQIYQHKFCRFPKGIWQRLQNVTVGDPEVKAILLYGAEQRLNVWRLHTTNGLEGSSTYRGRIWSVMKVYGSKLTRRSWSCQSRNVGRDGWGTCQGSSDDRIAKQVLHWIPEEKRQRGWPRVTWQHMIGKDTEKGGSTVIGWRQDRR